MANAYDLDGRFVSVLKEQTIIAAAESEAGLRWLELLHIAIARGKVAVGTVENVKGSLAVDAAQIGAGFIGPKDKQAQDWLVTHKPNSRSTSS